jgi:hypothetical protein
MRLLRWFCADHFLKKIEDDLFEYFQEEVENSGLKHAKERFIWLDLV